MVQVQTEGTEGGAFAVRAPGREREKSERGPAACTALRAQRREDFKAGRRPAARPQRRGAVEWKTLDICDSAF